MSWRRRRVPAALLGVAVLACCAGCSAGPFAAPSVEIASSSRVGSDGYPTALREYPATKYVSLLLEGQRLYSLRYWSRGIKVQGYLDVPAGPGPFPVLVDLHGGFPIPVPPQRNASGAYTPELAAESANSGTIVFIPSYAGYEPSSGFVCSPYDCAVDALNGLHALAHLTGLRIKPHSTYAVGFSLGGFVALDLAELDPQVRAVVADSPWPGAQAFTAWTKEVGVAHLDPVDLSFAIGVDTAFGERPTLLERHNSLQASSIHVPVLIVGGTRDRRNPPSLIRFLAAELRAGRVPVTLHMLDAGHAPVTAQFFRIVRAWLAPRGL